MKKRNGFVSNSSSASFIVKWKTKIIDETEPETILETVARLFELYSYDKENDTIRENENGWDKRDIEIVKWIVKNTKEIKPGVYQTVDTTGMMNSYADFSTEMAFFFVAINSDERFVVIDSKIDRD